MAQRATVQKRAIEPSETILEYVLDGLGPIPPQVKRNLSHIASLQKASDKLQSELRPLQDEYLQDSLKKIKDFPFPKNLTSSVPIPTTEELQSVITSPPHTSSISQYYTSLENIAVEKVDTARTILEFVEEHVGGIEEELRVMEGQLKEEGYFEPTGASAGDQVAIMLSPTSPTEWILAKVLSYNPDLQMYRIADEDPDLPNKTYNLPTPQVHLLNLAPHQIQKNDLIHAVYPDTTSFYSAKVICMRKVGGGNVVYVHFKDDQDEMGVTHEKPVLLKHVKKM
ncbi:hypothetical protein TrLO_g6374 [Triparma laevis f. longispina]|uniref:SGF29 C-terminal domain-containing protein n=1 Tax=Triparma laevis f. longispina TaxID=1714387 RepID=A0A9W7E1P9_9STRA|nr:hypothetical protein TrLO_g6374 [Triparma laevis f. longispina]